MLPTGVGSRIGTTAPGILLYGCSGKSSTMIGMRYLAALPRKPEGWWVALNAPESTFVGLDLSRVQIAEGQETVRALGLENVELRHLDLMDVTPELGRFDYIICHGVYSWVPEGVQEKILQIAAQNLTPMGV